MEGIRSYLVSVMAASLICAVTITLVGEKSGAGKIIKMLAGILLLTVIVKPAIDIKVSDWKHFSIQIQEECASAVQAGEKLAEDSFVKEASAAVEKRIKAEAEKIGCDIAVNVSWGEQMQMENITLEGNASPYAKNSLSKWIQENLEIPEESQNWIG